MSCRGLGELVPFFACPYDSIGDPGDLLPQLLQAQGMGDYLPAGPNVPPEFTFAKGLGSLLPAGPNVPPQFTFPGSTGMGDYLQAGPNVPIEFTFAKGMGCPDCGGGCGGMNGLTLDDTTGLFSGDVSSWGVGEWGLLVLAFYVVNSLISDVGKGASRATEKLRGIRSRSKRRDALKKRLSEL